MIIDTYTGSWLTSVLYAQNVSMCGCVFFCVRLHANEVPTKATSSSPNDYVGNTPVDKGYNNTRSNI